MQRTSLSDIKSVYWSIVDRIDMSTYDIFVWRVFFLRRLESSKTAQCNARRVCHTLKHLQDIGYITRGGYTAAMRHIHTHGKDAPIRTSLRGHEEKMRCWQESGHTEKRVRGRSRRSITRPTETCHFSFILHLLFGCLVIPHLYCMSGLRLVIVLLQTNLHFFSSI